MGLLNQAEFHLSSIMRRALGHSPPADASLELGRRGHAAGRQFRKLTASMKLMAGRLSLSFIFLLFCSLSLMSRLREDRLLSQAQIMVDSLWMARPSSGWRASALPRQTWPLAPSESNGYLLVRCNGGLNQQRSAICNAVLAARIMNATLVLPALDTNSFWRDKSGFSGIYDVEHFIRSLKNDVHIVRSGPTYYYDGKKKKKFKPFLLKVPRDAPPSWYETVALEKMKEHGAVHLTPFSHRLAEELDNMEYQRLRCRVNFHALRFNEDVMKLSNLIVQRLRSEGHFMAIHLRFELDMLAFAGCLAIFTPEEQQILKQYREQNFAKKHLVYNERRLIGKCPLTPEEVGLVLKSMGFHNSTRIYIAAGDIFGGERFMKPLRDLFPHLENRSSIATPRELAAVSANERGLLGPAIDYMVCLLADIFMPTYDGPSNFANNLIGHRLYFGFRTTIQPNRKALAPIFMDRERGWTRNFDARVRLVMQNSSFGGPHLRIPPESFYTNPWPECFCQSTSSDSEHACPVTVMDMEDEWLTETDRNQQVKANHTAQYLLSDVGVAHDSIKDESV